jgi:hypothetical protein
MSRQKQVLREIAKAINSNGPYRIAEWSTEDFRFVDPTIGSSRRRDKIS